MGGHCCVKAAPSTPLTYVFSSMHLSAKKSPGRQSAPQAGPLPPPHLSPTPAALESILADPQTADCITHPPPRPCSSKQRGGPVPPWAQSRLPAPGRLWALRLRGARAESQCACPCVPMGTPTPQVLFLGLAPHQAGDLCILGADPGPGTQWVRGEPGEGVFPGGVPSCARPRGCRPRSRC